MTDKKKEAEKKESVKFLNSTRGQYIISQALWTAIKRMKELPSQYQEKSNINDMTYLMENLFPLYNTIRSGDKQVMEKFGAPFVCLKCTHAWKTKKEPKICPECKTKLIRSMY